MNTDSGAPPAWADALEETQYILSRLRVKIDSLIELHSKQLTRPTLDDTSQVREFLKLQFINCQMTLLVGFTRIGVPCKKCIKQGK